MTTGMKDWRRFWRGVPSLREFEAGTDSQKMQVGKTVLGKPVADAQIQLIVSTIRIRLGLKPEDSVCDFGCGNGLLTSHIAKLSAHVLAVDLSEQLITTARRLNASANIQYMNGDLCDLPAVTDRAEANKGYAYEVLQHLSTNEAAKFLQDVRQCWPRIDCLLLGSIPDRARLRNFYDSPQRWERFEKMSASGGEQIGHWWERANLERVAASAGFSLEPIEQNPELYTAHYRFDALLHQQ